MKKVLAIGLLALIALTVWAAVPPGGLRINYDTSGTNTTSASVTVTSLTNLNAGKITVTNLVASRAVITDASKGLVSSAVTSTELAYVGGVTSAIQTQLDAKSGLTVGTAILKGNGLGGFADAVASTDYAPATSGSAILKGNGSGGFSAASAGTDYADPAVTISAGAGMSGGGSLAANRTLTWDASTFVNNITFWDGTQASRNMVFAVTGTDPVLIASSTGLNLQTGILQQGGTSVALQSRTISTTAPITGGGDLSADRTIALTTGAGVTNSSGALIANLAQGANVTLTTGANGQISIASSGTVTASGGALTANAIVLGAGTTDLKVSSSITTDGSAKVTLGTLDLGNTTDTTISRSGAGVLAVEGVDQVNVNRAITIAGTANEITSSTGSQNLSADRTWTLSLPSAMTFTSKTITGGTFTSPLLTTPDIGNADTTLSRFGAGQLSVEGVAVPTVTSTDTLQNKTEATTWAGGNNTHTRRVYLPLQFTRVAATSMIVNSNDFTLASYSRPRFPGNSTATNSNYAIYRAIVPIKFVGASGQDLTMEKLTYKTTGTQTGATTFNIGVLDVADSAAADPADSTSFGNYVALTSGTLTSSAANDRFSTANVTLTGWRSALTAGHDMAVCIVRNDTNTDGMDLIDILISYVETQ